MKNILLLAALILSATMGTSCNKNNDNDENLESIVAKWTLEKVDYHEYEAGASDRYTEVAMVGDYFDFRANGQLFMRIDGDNDEGTWRMEGNQKVWISATDFSDVAIFDILNINNNNLLLYLKETDGADYYEATVYFKK